MRPPTVTIASINAHIMSGRRSDPGYPLQHPAAATNGPRLVMGGVAVGVAADCWFDAAWC